MHAPWATVDGSAALTLHCTYGRHLRLCVQIGQQYTVRVSATDVAGVTGYAETDAVRIVAKTRSLSPGYVAAIVVGVTILTFGLAVAITMIITRHRRARWWSCAPLRLPVGSAGGVQGSQRCLAHPFEWCSQDVPGHK